MAEKRSETNASSLWVKVLAWALVLGLLAVVALQLRASQRGVLTHGDPAPEFTLTTFDGQEIGPADMAGKVVLVNIWASWCQPCAQEAEALQTAWEQYQGRGDVLFLGVDYVDTQKEASAYLEKYAITYPNGPDLKTIIYTAFRARGVPETYFINRDGEVVQVQIGPFASLDDITAVIDRLLEP